MKTVGIEQADFDTCLRDAQTDRVLITEDGAPLAIIVGVQGMDQEQLRLSGSGEFWQLISQRRRQPTVDRAELEKRIQQGKQSKQS